MKRRSSDGIGAPARWLSGTGLSVAIVAAIVVSSVAVLAFTRDDGATTSEQAVLDLLAAVQANDVIGVLEQLPPGERKDLRDGIGDISSELQRAGLVTGLDLHHVDGPTITITGLLLRTSNLSKDMDAVDLVGGNASVQLPAGDPPLTPAARDALQSLAGVRVDPAGMSFTRDFAADALRLIAIREGGGWHVSLAYTVAEQLRSASGVSFPEMGKGPPQVGAPTPEAVVRDLVRAYADADAERLVTLTFPDETRALYDYAPAFLPHEKEVADTAATTNTYDVQINDVKTEVDGSGPTRTVRITAFDVDIKDELKKAHVTYDGRCLHLDHRIGDADPYEKWDACDNELPKPGDPVMPREDPIITLSIFGGGVDLPAFVVLERGGRWFLSPARTLLDAIVATVRDQPTEVVDAFLKRLSDSVRGGAGDGLVGAAIEPPPPADGRELDDDAKAKAKADALLDACAQLVTQPKDKATAVGDACKQHLVETGRVTADQAAAH